MHLAPTAYTRFNRGFVLLALGRWDEGFAEYEACERERPFQRPKMRGWSRTGKNGRAPGGV